MCRHLHHGQTNSAAIVRSGGCATTPPPATPQSPNRNTNTNTTHYTTTPTATHHPYHSKTPPPQPQTHTPDNPRGTITPQTTNLSSGANTPPNPPTNYHHAADHYPPRRPALGSFLAAGWNGFRKNGHILASITLTFLGLYVAPGSLQSLVETDMPNSVYLPLALGLTATSMLFLGFLAFMKASLDIAHTGSAGLLSSLRGYSRVRAGLLVVSSFALVVLGLFVPLVGPTVAASLLMILLPAYMHRRGSYTNAFRDCLNVTTKKPLGFIALWFTTSLMTQTILTIIFAGLAVVTSESPNDSDQALILTMVLYPILALPVLSLLSI